MLDIDTDKYLMSCNNNNPDCTKKWVTKEGKNILIYQMDDNHLINSMLRIQRLWPWRSEYYHCICKEAQRRNLI